MYISSTSIFTDTGTDGVGRCTLTCRSGCDDLIAPVVPAQCGNFQRVIKRQGTVFGLNMKMICDVDDDKLYGK